MGRAKRLSFSWIGRISEMVKNSGSILTLGTLIEKVRAHNKRIFKKTSKLYHVVNLCSGFPIDMQCPRTYVERMHFKKGVVAKGLLEDRANNDAYYHPIVSTLMRYCITW